MEITVKCEKMIIIKFIIVKRIISSVDDVKVYLFLK